MATLHELRHPLLLAEAPLQWSYTDMAPNLPRRKYQDCIHCAVAPALKRAAFRFYFPPVPELSFGREVVNL